MAVAVAVAAAVVAVVAAEGASHRDTTFVIVRCRCCCCCVVVAFLFGRLQGNTLRTPFGMETIVAENCNISHAGTVSDFQVFGELLISDTQWLCGLPSDWQVFTHSV